MHSSTPHNPDPHNPPAYANQSGYEKRDVVLPTIIIWVTFLFLFIIGSSAISYFLYIVLSPRNTVDPAAVARSSSDPQDPPAPQVQAYPKTEMKDFRIMEQAAVGGYGKYRGVENRYRIPVDRALELTAERGFPKTETMSREASRAEETNVGGIPRGMDSRNIDNQNPGNR